MIAYAAQLADLLYNSMDEDEGEADDCQAGIYGPAGTEDSQTTTIPAVNVFVGLGRGQHLNTPSWMMSSNSSSA